jgi:hypothetical protein
VLAVPNAEVRVASLEAVITVKVYVVLAIPSREETIIFFPVVNEVATFVPSASYISKVEPADGVIADLNAVKVVPYGISVIASLAVPPVLTVPIPEVNVAFTAGGTHWAYSVVVDVIVKISPSR